MRREAAWPKMILAGVMSLMLSACASGDYCQTLTFRTLHRQLRDSGWTSHDPGLRVVTSALDWADTAALVTPSDQAKIEAVDYAQDLVLVAFMGFQGQLYPDYQIERIVRRGDVVAVHASIITDPIVRADAVSSPYHAVIVAKRGDWGRTIRFQFYLNDELLVEHDRWVP